MNIAGGAITQLKKNFKIKNLGENINKELTKKVILSIYSSNFKISPQGTMSFKYEKQIIFVKGYTITGIIELSKSTEDNCRKFT